MVAKSYKYQVAFLIAVVSFLVFTLLPLVVTKQRFDALTGEQGVFQSLTIAYLFATSFLLFLSFLRFRNRSWLLRLSYLVLSILILVVTLQSVALGNKIFNWNLDEYMRQVSFRRVISSNSIGDFAREFAIRAINFNQFLMFFVLIFVLAIPLLTSLWPKVGKVLATVIPVMPVGAGVLAVAAYILSRWGAGFLPSLHSVASLSMPQVEELSNHAYAFALLVSVVFYFMIKLDEKKKEDDEMLLRELTYYRR